MSAILEHDGPNPRLVDIVRHLHLIAHGRRVPIPVLAYVDLPCPTDWTDADVETLEDSAFHQLWFERIIWAPRTPPRGAVKHGLKDFPQK